MGQSQCCQTQFDDHDLIINLNNKQIRDPIEAGISAHLESNKQQESVLISRLGFRDGSDGDYIEQEPALTNAVYDRLQLLGQLKMDESQLIRGKEERGYFKFRKTGIVYIGEWKNGVPNGYGKNYYPNAGLYEGSFVDGIPHGYGRFIMPDGDLYQGDVRFERANGSGIYETGSLKYKGCFKDNVKHGKGVQEGHDYYFSGEYEYGEKKQGMLKYGGSVYEGEFLDDLFNGKGMLTTNKCVYTGSFKAGQQHGYGESQWADGSSYRGNHHQGYREGQGQYFNSKNSSISRGLWREGTLNGEGEYIERGQQSHKVIWSSGKISAVFDH